MCFHVFKKMNNTTLNSTNTFQWIDYTVFSFMLGLSALIGLYFGIFGKKQDSPEEYLHGGKKMKILPIAASLIASDVSGILFLGAPSDVYMNGTSYAWSILASFVANFAIISVYLPVFFNLQMTSCFEYLKIRFSSRTRSMASAIYTFNQCLYLPIVMYTSVLAFGQVSKVNLNLLTVIVCIICIVYTMLGGIKAVVWTDTLQMCAMVGSLLVVLALGVSVEPGGFKKIWETSLKTGRIDTNLDFDPTSRTATFTILIGLAVYHLSYGCNPMYIQRFMSLPTERNTKISVHLLMVGILFFRTFTTLLGLIIYTRYANCDPISSGSIQKLDQLVPYYVMDVASALPGLPGIFIAGIFCAALSTMSSFLNTLSGTIYEDFIKDRMPANTTKKRASDIMKIIVAVLGILSMLLVFVVQHLGGILELTYVIRGAVTGPVLAMFTLGILIPYINEKGIFYGSIGGFLIMLWLAVGAKYYTMTGQLVTKRLPLSTEGCILPLKTTMSNYTTTETYNESEYLSNSTVANFTIPNEYLGSENSSEPFYLYRISFYYYCLVGIIATTIIALPVSWFTRKKKEIIDNNLFSPVIYKFILNYNHQIRREDMKNDKELVLLNLNKKLVENE